MRRLFSSIQNTTFDNASPPNPATKTEKGREYSHYSFLRKYFCVAEYHGRRIVEVFDFR